MTRIKIRIQLNLSKEIYKDVKRRKDFNASKFFEKNYREQFLNKQGCKQMIETLTKDLELYQDRLASMTGSEVVTPELNKNRCPMCNMFFHEDIAIRKKIHVYKSLYVCAQCKQEQSMKIEELVKELKANEPEKEE